MKTVIVTVNYTEKEIRVFDVFGVNTLCIYATGNNPIRGRDADELLDKAIGYAVGEASRAAAPR